MLRSVYLLKLVLLVTFISSCSEEDDDPSSQSTASNYYANITFRGVNYSFSQNGLSSSTGMLAADNNGGGWAATMQYTGASTPNFICNLFLGDGLVGVYQQQSIQFMPFPGSTVYTGLGEVTITHARMSQYDYYEGTFSGTLKNLDSLQIPGVTQNPISGSFKLATSW